MAALSRPSSQQTEACPRGDLGKASTVPSTVQGVVDFVKENKGTIFFAASIIAIPIFAMPSLATYSIAELISCAVEGTMYYLMLRIAAFALTGQEYNIQNTDHLALLLGAFSIANFWCCSYCAIEYTTISIGALAGFVTEKFLYPQPANMLRNNKDGTINIGWNQRVRLEQPPVEHVAASQPPAAVVAPQQEAAVVAPQQEATAAVVAPQQEAAVQ